MSAGRRQGDRLAAVLRVRRVQEQVAAGRLAVAEAERRRAVATRDERRAEISAPHRHRQVVELAWAGADRAAVALVAADHAAAAERTTWTAAAQRVKGLERLDERLREEQRTAELRRQATVLDDLVTTRVAREHVQEQGR